MVHFLLPLLFVQVQSLPQTAISAISGNELQLTIKNLDAKSQYFPNIYLLNNFVTSLSFEDCYIGNSQLDAVSRFPNIKSLTIKLPKNANIDLSRLRQNPSIVSMSCFLTRDCTVLGLTTIPQLHSLALAGSINDHTFEDLVKHGKPKQLKNVLISSKADAIKIGMFLKLLTDVSELRLSGDSITDATVANITAIENLKLLIILQAPVTGETIPLCSKLKSLWLRGCKITNNGVDKISLIDSLEILYITDSDYTNIDKLTRLKMLRRLHITDSKVSNVTALFAMPALEFINVVGCPIKEENLRPPDRIHVIK